MRMMSDISTLTSKTSSAEDKLTAAKSLGGFSVEMAIFKGIAFGMSLLLGSVTKALMGQDETKEEYQKRKDNSFKAQMTGTASDLFSPLPMLDYPVVKGVDFIGDLAQDFANVEDKDKSHLYTNYKTDIPKSLGVFGIGLSKANDLAQIINLSATGHFKDEYGRDKYISQSDQDALKTIGAISLISNFGLAPAEVNTIAKNAVKYAEKNASSKEGGQTDEDIKIEKMAKEQTELNKEESQQLREEKANALEKLKESESDENKINIMDKKIKEYRMTKEERNKYNEKRKKELFEEKKTMKNLLGNYRTMYDMKRYDPALYEERFGEDSEWYKQHKDEMEVDNMMNDALKEIKDEQQGYIEIKNSKDQQSTFGKNSFDNNKKTKQSTERKSSFGFNKTKKW